MIVRVNQFATRKLYSLELVFDAIKKCSIELDYN
jgi:hypothetical protein